MDKIMQWGQLFLMFCNICIMVYVFFKFINKPHDSLEERVEKCEENIKDIKQSLYRGDGRFQEHERAIKVLVRSVIALVEFEMQYCLKEDYPVSKGLEKSKEELNEYLSTKHGTEI